MKYSNKLMLSLLLLAGTTTQAMDSQEIWFDETTPLYSKSIARNPEGYRVLLLQGPDQNGYFTQIFIILDGPKKGFIVVKSDDYNYQERRTITTDSHLFEYLQQKYQEQNLPEKG